VRSDHEALVECRVSSVKLVEWSQDMSGTPFENARDHSTIASGPLIAALVGRLDDSVVGIKPI
jgi:hypothetical protein